MTSGRRGRVDPIGLAAQINGHATDPDAHHSNQGLTYLNGAWVSPNYQMQHIELVVTAARMYAHLLHIEDTIEFDEVLMHVRSADIGGVGRLALYADDGLFYPGALIEDFGELSVNAGVVVSIVLGVPRTLTRGWYWLASNYDGTPGMKTVAPISFAPNPLGHVSGSPRYQYTHYRVVQAYGAFPDPFTAGGTLLGADTEYCPCIVIHDST